MTKAVGCVLVLMLAACGGAPTAASSPSAPPSASPSVEPIAQCVDPDEQARWGVSVTVAGDGAVRALVMGTGTTAVVFANMSDNNLCNWLPTAVEYSTKGYRTAVFRYSDRQQGDADVVALVDQLRRTGATRIALVGASAGGDAVICAAAKARADAVVELSAPDAYSGMDAATAVKTLTVPTLFTVGQLDEDFVESSKALHAASPAKDKRLDVVLASAHGTDLMARSVVKKSVRAFLTQYAPAT